MWSGRQRMSIGVGLLLASLTAISGCGSGAPSPIPAGPKGSVSGVVQLNGKPVPAGCSVTFTNEKVNVPAMATTAADGSYSLEIMGTLQIPVGLYKVTVKSPQKPPMTDAEYEQYMQEQQKGSVDKLKADADSSAIPIMYANTGTTSLKFEIKAGSNTYDIKLTQ